MEIIVLDRVKSRLKDIIVHDLDVNIGVDEIRDDVSLYEDGVGLDSISIINFIVLIEEKFNFKFAEEEVTAQLFSCLNNLAEFINTKVSYEQPF